MEITVKKLTLKTIDDFFYFFDNIAFSDHKEWEGCYCMFFHLTDEMKRKNEERGYMDNSEFAREYIKSGKLQGYLAYHDDKVAAFCNANDKESYIYYNKENEPEIWDENPNGRIKIITCFTVAPDMRRQGIASKLLEAIIEDSINSGYDYVEAYPFIGEQNQFAHYRGPLKLYEKFGFKKISDTKENHIVRKKL
jgi:GNAT superfamily N-acetyltransferase